MENTAAVKSSKKEKASWSKRIEQDGESKNIRVREVENGYVIDYEHHYKDKKGEYQFNEKTYISKENPIKGNKSFTQELNENDSLFDSIEL
jgi:F0F1-type ATP synthase alpha subunit